MTYNLATYYDKAYLAKGLALLASLARHLDDWRLYVLALDGLSRDATEEIAEARGLADRVRVYPLSEIESPLMLKAKAGRSWREYIFTLTPCWPLWLLEREHLADLAYIDSDCYLFADLAPIYAEIGEASIAAVPHRWTPRHAERLRPNGIYNVGWLYWRNNNAGRLCLADWRSACLNWNRPAHSKPFSDQIFLDRWPLDYGQHFREIRHPGANLAPWNIERYSYARTGARLEQLLIEAGEIASDGIYSPRLWPLIWYHFHEWHKTPQGIRRTGYPIPLEVASLVYLPYESEIENADREIQRLPA